MIMFLFFLIILLRNIIFALPITKITDVYIEGTTIVPHDMIDNILMTNVQNSSKHLHKSVSALQSAVDILFPKKTNFIANRQSLLIGCIFNRLEASEEQRRACKGLHEKNDKKVFYEFDDKSLEHKNTVTGIEHSPIHVEHINVARVENNREETINNTIEEIQKLTVIDNRANNSDSISAFSSTSVYMSYNTMNGNRSKHDNNEEMLHWLTTNSTTDISSNIKTVEQSSKLKSNSLINEQMDDDDIDSKNDISSETNNDNEKFDQEDEQLKEPTVGLWSTGRLSNDPIPKNVLLTDLAKALETLETIVDGKGLDTDGDQISFKPADLRSIIKSQNISFKFLQFLNTIKNTIEQ